MIECRMRSSAPLHPQSVRVFILNNSTGNPFDDNEMKKKNRKNNKTKTATSISIGVPRGPRRICYHLSYRLYQLIITYSHVFITTILTTRYYTSSRTINTLYVMGAKVQCIFFPIQTQSCTPRITIIHVVYTQQSKPNIFAV